MTTYILANFGGPRNLFEVGPFLKALLTDSDVTGTAFPSYIHRPLFTVIAKLRTKKVRTLYESIGGKSPIFQDTEILAEDLRVRLQAPVLTFHRYLPETHRKFTDRANRILAPDSPTVVLPLFPHFTYSVTGSIARFFSKHLDNKNLSWIKSFGTHPEFIISCVDHILEFLKNKGLDHKQCILIFSLHGLPQSFIFKGDPYEKECTESFKAITQYLPGIKSILCYQSQVGPAKWLKPYTTDVCEKLQPRSGEKHAVVFPFGFLSDHLETLYEIERLYLPKLEKNGFNAHRIPTLGKTEFLGNMLKKIIRTTEKTTTEQLLKKF